MQNTKRNGNGVYQNGAKQVNFNDKGREPGGFLPL